MLRSRFGASCRWSSRYLKTASLAIFIIDVGKKVRQLIAAHYMPTALSSCCKIYKSFSFLIRPRAAVSRSRRSFHCRYCNNTFQSDVSEAEYVFPHLVPCFMNINFYIYFLSLCHVALFAPCVCVSPSHRSSFVSTAFFSLLFFFFYCGVVSSPSSARHLWVPSVETRHGGRRDRWWRRPGGVSSVCVCVCVCCLCLMIQFGEGRSV